jgi:hypothetical protein
MPYNGVNGATGIKIRAIRIASFRSSRHIAGLPGAE